MSVGKVRKYGYEKIVEEIEKEKAELRKEHKIPGGIVPSTKTLKSHDLFTERLIRDLKHDPVKELVELSRTARSELVRANINLTLLEYMIPKLKAVDTNPNQGETIQINVVMPGSNKPEAIQVIQPGSLPFVSEIESNHNFEEEQGYDE